MGIFTNCRRSLPHEYTNTASADYFWLNVVFSGVSRFANWILFNCLVPLSRYQEKLHENRSRSRYRNAANFEGRTRSISSFSWKFKLSRSHVKKLWIVLLSKSDELPWTWKWPFSPALSSPKKRHEKNYIHFSHPLSDWCTRTSLRFLIEKTNLWRSL